MISARIDSAPFPSTYGPMSPSIVLGPVGVSFDDNAVPFTENTDSVQLVVAKPGLPRADAALLILWPYKARACVGRIEERRHEISVSFTLCVARFNQIRGGSCRFSR